jgi:hypothetical protein
LVFGELRGGTSTTYVQVIGGSLLMAAGAAAIALSSATGREHACWQEAAERESRRYKVDAGFVHSRMYGEESSQKPGRTWLDWALAAVAGGIILAFGALAEMPRIALNWGWVTVLTAAMLALLVGSAWALWRVTRFT